MFEENIKKARDAFDFETVHKIITLRSVKWEIEENYFRTPTLQEIKNKVDFIIDVITDVNYDGDTRFVSSEGFQIIAFPSNEVVIQYILSESSS